MQIQTPKTIVSQDELKSLRPKDREEYIQNLLLQILALNSQGVTIPELESATRIHRNTLSSHIKNLVATREAYSVDRGKLSIFYKNGKVVHARSTEYEFPHGKFYKFFRLENEDGKFIYIQERQLDEFRAVKVKGGIMINDNDFFNFLKELQKFALEVSKYESE